VASAGRRCHWAFQGEETVLSKPGCPCLRPVPDRARRAPSDSWTTKALLTAITEHGLVPAWTEVIVPTLRAVGRKWETPGEKYVEVEHFLSWHVSGALRCATPHPVAARAGATPVLACVPGRTTPCRWKCRPRPGCGRSALLPPAGRRLSTSQPWSGSARCPSQAGRADAGTRLGGAGGGGPGASVGTRRGGRCSGAVGLLVRGCRSTALGRGAWAAAGKHGPLDQWSRPRRSSTGERCFRATFRHGSVPTGSVVPAEEGAERTAVMCGCHGYGVDRGEA
jgi:hypothetical protein